MCPPKSVSFTVRLRSLLVVVALPLLGVLSMPVVSAAHRYVVGSSADVAPNAIRASNVGSGSATNTYVLTADGSGNSAWEAVPAGATPGLGPVLTAGNTSTVHLPMILNPGTAAGSGTAFQATTMTYDTAASITASGSSGTLSLNQTRASLGIGPVANELSVVRTGGGSDTDSGALIFGNENAGGLGSVPLIELQSANVDMLSFTKAGNLTIGSLASNPGLATDGAGKFIGQAQADATHSGFLGSTDWNTFNSKLSSYTETDPASLHTSGGSNTMGQTLDMGGHPITNAGDFHGGNIFADQLVDNTGNIAIVAGGAGTGHITLSSPSTGVNFQGSPVTTSAPTGTGALALPATPTGYLEIQVGGVNEYIPYYAP